MGFPDPSDHSISSPLSPQVMTLVILLFTCDSVSLSLQRGVFGIFLLGVRVRGSLSWPCQMHLLVSEWLWNYPASLCYLEAERGQQMLLQTARKRKRSFLVVLPIPAAMQHCTPAWLSCVASFVPPNLSRETFLLLHLTSFYWSLKVQYQSHLLWGAFPNITQVESGTYLELLLMHLFIAPHTSFVILGSVCQTLWQTLSTPPTRGPCLSHMGT